MSMMASGTKIGCMGVACLLGKMAGGMRAATSKTKSMDMAHTHGKSQLVFD